MPLTQFRLDLPALADPHMRGPYMETLLGSVGAELDARAEQVMWGRLQSYVFAGGANPGRVGAARLADGRLIECEPFVIPLHAEERGLRLYPTQTVLSQRVLCSKHLEVKRQRGTPWGEADHLRTYFVDAVAIPRIHIAWQVGDGSAAIWQTVNPDGSRRMRRVSPSNMDFDSQPAKRTRWWAFIEMRAAGYSIPNTYNDGHTWNDGGLYDTGSTTPVTTAIARDLIDMLKFPKAAHSRLSGVGLLWNVGGIDPGGTPTQDVSGWWSHPGGGGAGTWADPIYRPPYLSMIYLDLDP